MCSHFKVLRHKCIIYVLYYRNVNNLLKRVLLYTYYIFNYRIHIRTNKYKLYRLIRVHLCDIIYYTSARVYR